jgi:two-component system sensor histidine kinase HydH
MAGRASGRKARAASFGISLVTIAALAFVDVVIFRSMDERDSLQSRNVCEGTMNVLFASLRDHEDFGSAIESSAELRERVSALGIYKTDGSSLYSWGKAPATYEAPGRITEGRRGADIKFYIENPKDDSFILILHPFSVVPPPPREARPPEPKDGLGAAAQEGGGPEAQAALPRAEHRFFFTTMKSAEFVYLEIRQPEYWRAKRFREILFPLSLAIVAGFVFFVRALLIRNAEYRVEIEEQKNLVVLGTAAATLAHEIKNPLLSIRLQSSILERLCPAEAKRELTIINDEVDRLSALAYRINDYLREPRGKPLPVDAAEAAREASRRLLGRDVVAEGPVSSRPAVYRVLVDPERFRSVLENLLRNAVESGGEASGLAVELGRDDGKVLVDVLDRGPGVPAENRERAFDPFFTTKSRGTGIGLAISRRFIQAVSGDISIGDRPGGGARVRITLPEAGGAEVS